MLLTVTAPLPPLPTPSPATVLARNAVQVLGHGKPPLLLCNGFSCSQTVWHHFVAALGVHHQVILFDHVGSGASDPDAYDPLKYGTLAGYAQDVVEICQALELRGAVIMGHSVGATIALLAAAQAPEHFAKAVLLAPSPCYLNRPGYYGGFERTDLDDILALLDTDTWGQSFAHLLTGPANPDSVAEELAEQFCASNSAAARRFARVAFLSDHRADVPRLRLPTLVLQCTHDMVVPPAVGAYLLQHLPDARLMTLRATGHCPHLSAPVETLAALLPFLTNAEA
ncbi:MAG: alpha/beta fold hydrolase [Janthinobacterium lividum]